MGTFFLTTVWFLTLGFQPFNQTKLNDLTVETTNTFTQQLGVEFYLGTYGKIYTDIEVYDTPVTLFSWSPYRIDFSIGAELKYMFLSLGVYHECDHDVSIPWRDQSSLAGVSYGTTRYYLKGDFDVAVFNDVIISLSPAFKLFYNEGLRIDKQMFNNRGSYIITDFQGMGFGSIQNLDTSVSYRDWVKIFFNFGLWENLTNKTGLAQYHIKTGIEGSYKRFTLGLYYETYQSLDENIFNVYQKSFSLYITYKTENT